MRVVDGEAEFGRARPGRGAAWGDQTVVPRDKNDKLSKRPLIVRESGPTDSQWITFREVRSLFLWFEHRTSRGGSWLGESYFDLTTCRLLVGHTEYEIHKDREKFYETVLQALEVEGSFFDNKKCQAALDNYRKGI